MTLIPAVGVECRAGLSALFPGMTAVGEWCLLTFTPRCVCVYGLSVGLGVPFSNTCSRCVSSIGVVSSDACSWHVRHTTVCGVYGGGRSVTAILD